MKAYLLSGAAILGVVALALITTILLSSLSGRDGKDTYRVTPPIFGKAVVVCANLGGLRYFSSTSKNQEIANVRAVCNAGVEARFQIRYDGKPEGESK